MQRILNSLLGLLNLNGMASVNCVCPEYEHFATIIDAKQTNRAGTELVRLSHVDILRLVLIGLDHARLTTTPTLSYNFTSSSYTSESTIY